MSYVRYSYETLRIFVSKAFEKFGFTPGESEIITDVLLLADLYGIESHGMQRLGRYHRAIVKGSILLGRELEVVFETPVSAVIDGHEGMGQLIGHFAMELAIKKAETAGVGMVSVRNSNHYGIAGYYAKMACDRGLIGISVTNTAGIMVPTYGRRAMLGSNPIAVAVPADPVPFFFDASTTLVTRGRLEVYQKAEKPLPLGWAVNAQGQQTEDAGDVLKNIDAKAGGGIVPLGGVSEDTGSHKGYGFAMLSEIFSSILSMGTTSQNTYMGTFCGVCHGFMAIDPGVFGDALAIKEHFSTYLQQLRDSEKMEGQSRIYTHGEKEVEAQRQMLAQGIPIADKTMDEVRALCSYLDMDFNTYFG